MTKRTQHTRQLAKTRQGEVILIFQHELRYSFRFGTLHRVLTAHEFHRLHQSALAFDPHQHPAKPIHLTGESAPYVSVESSPFDTLSSADWLELQQLLGRAALLVCTMARAYQDVN